MHSANFKRRNRKIAKSDDRDIWIQWTENKGTFTIHRNGDNPVFPLSHAESEWVRFKIKEIYDLPT